MGRYALTRVGQGAVTIIAISIAVFALTHLFGDPVVMMVPVDASNELLWTTRESLGLNDPILIQFKDFALDALKGDFGPSLSTGESSRTMLVNSLFATLILAAAAFALALLTGLILGITAALRPNTWLDKLVNGISVGGISMPEFWLALILISVVAVQLGWLPTSGYGSWQNLVLPAIVLSVRPMGRIAQITRAAMIDELRQQYTLTARAKGLRTAVIIRRHVLKNASINIVTITGIELADLISGTIIVETIFAWPGIGRLAGVSLVNMDFPVIQTVVLWAAVVTITANLLVDLSYTWLNPRIRFT